MAVQIDELQISQLLAERKILADNYLTLIQVRPKRGHSERELLVKGENGSDFSLILRQSEYNKLDFSVILAYLVPKTNVLFRLRRYNGKSHEHTNPYEGQKFFGFHIHIATERYQQSGMREDTYAEQTNAYSDLNGAIQCMLNDCGFVLPPSAQQSLF
jgi:hypothetical protein